MKGKALRNQKGDVVASKPFSLILFAILIVFVVSTLTLMQLTANSTATSIMFHDANSSVNMITEALITYPECFGSGEKGILDKSKVEDIENRRNCVHKGPYTWEIDIFAENEYGGEINQHADSDCGILSTATQHGSSIDYDVSKYVTPYLVEPITIRGEGSDYVGWMYFYLGSMEFAMVLDKKDRDNYELTVVNVGNCHQQDVTYDVRISIANVSNGEIPVDFIDTYGIEFEGDTDGDHIVKQVFSLGIDENKKMALKINNPDNVKLPSDYMIRVVGQIDGHPAYSKTMWRRVT
ncbi:MAG: hypothetical protein ABIG20_02140 [archaeon]